jgi:hypothetical protein
MEKGRDKKWKAEKEIYIFYKVLCQRCIKFLIPPSGGGGGVNQVCWGRISSCEEGKEI